jgi:acyl dehydratase
MSNSYQIGDKASFSRQFHDEDVALFAQISHDDNPIHLDDAVAAASIFGKKVVHGIFTVSMFSKIFGTIYPGNGGIYLHQSSKFLRPVFVGDHITAEVELIDFHPEKRIGVFATRCFNGAGDMVVDGEAKIKMP